MFDGSESPYGQPLGYASGLRGLLRIVRRVLGYTLGYPKCTEGLEGLFCRSHEVVMGLQWVD
jgi:hypothetical protein